MAPAFARAETGLPQDLIDCRALTDTGKRLVCYDRVVDAALSESATADADEIPLEVVPRAATPVPRDRAPGPATTDTGRTAATDSTDAQAAAIAPEALFGKSGTDIRETVQKATGTEEIDSITAAVRKLGYTRHGKAVMTLDNGQVWVQIDTLRLRLSANDVVEIRRASLGSFLLNKSGSKRSIRVRRIS